ELVREREARGARDESERRLLRERVHFIDDAVDLERQLVALVADALVIVQEAVEPVDDGALARNRQAESLEEIEYRRLCLRRALVPAPVDLAHAVGKER